MTANEQREGPRIITVASGKGGTGKSLLAANIGIFLATLGKRVILLDASFGSPSAHLFVGVPRPERTLTDFLASKTTALGHVVVPTPLGGLGLIAGEGDPAWVANPKSAQINRLIARIKQLDADYLVIDALAGTNGSALDLFLIADSGLLVVIPEPTAVESAYRFIRSAFVRRLRKIGVASAAELAPEELRDYEGGIPSPIDIHGLAADSEEGGAVRIASEMSKLQPHFVVNNVRTKADMELGETLARAVHRRMGVPAGYVGHMEYDDAVWVAVRRRRPLLIEHPESRIARCIERVVRRVLAREHEKSRKDRTRDTFYGLMGIEPSATEEEIRRANRRVREIYARDSLVVGGLYNKQRLEELMVRIDEAYETLMDSAARKAYDVALFPGGVPASADRDSSPATVISDHPGDGRQHPRLSTELEAADAGGEAARDSSAAEPAPPAPELAPDTVFTGELMREVREQQGLALRTISERTKIGLSYLAAIEEENFHKLPAVVYVRGFLVEYARMLRLDVDRVLGTYLERYKQARSEP